MIILPSNDHYKVMQATLKAGDQMPNHYATSDAFIVVVKGRAKLLVNGTEIALIAGGHYSLPAMQAHPLQIEEDFEACIVLAAGGDIQFPALGPGL